MIRKITNKVSECYEYSTRKLATKHVIAKVELDKDENVKKFADILKFFNTNKKWTNDELSFFEIIDNIREDYLNSQEKITIIDYGAGSPNSDRLQQQMENGVSGNSYLSEIYKSASTAKTWGELIFKIIRDFKPEKCLELGTSLGISGAYQISALKLNGFGELITIEGSPHLAEIAGNNFEKFNYKGVNLEKEYQFL